MEHRAPLTVEQAVTISALTIPRPPIADPLAAKLDDLQRQLVEADAVRRELEAARRILWAIAHRSADGVRVSDGELVAAPGLGSLFVEAVPGGLKITAAP